MDKEFAVSEKSLLDIRSCPVGDAYPKYIFPICMEVATEKGVGEFEVFDSFRTALWMVSISVQETGWGASVKSEMGNNVAGIHASKGRPQITLEEGMTGDDQDYRYYTSFKECFYSLHYLIRASSNFHIARNAFYSQIVNCETEMARRHTWAIYMHEFSRVYSEDPSHGSNVIALYRSLEPFFLPENQQS